jgi:hypothetical protein
VLDDGRVLPESNAILCHLAEGTEYLPVFGYERSIVLAWLFFEQYGHEPYVATPRFLVVCAHTSRGRVRFRPGGVSADQLLARSRPRVARVHPHAATRRVDADRLTSREMTRDLPPVVLVFAGSERLLLAVHPHWSVSLAGALLPLCCAHDLLPKRSVAAGAGLQRV